MQAEESLSRTEKFDNKLYLEFGGKLFDDYHASRVLPGFQIDTKIQMLSTLKDRTEYIIVANANDIEENKIRADINISYENDVLRLVNKFKEFGIETGSVVINQFSNQPNTMRFMRKLKNSGIPFYKAYRIDNYPYDTDLILSEKGFGKNEFVPTVKPLVVVTAPGPGSGKMAVCLSQLYHDFKLGLKSGYAKFETFPVWNLPLKHPVNLAYEAATTDLSDVNMIDQYHLEYYGVSTVNYNRDIDVFPVLNKMFKMIYGESPYHSPTDMGVNKVGFCIDDMDGAIEASKKEILRRYYANLVNVKTGKWSEQSLNRMVSIMEELDLTIDDRKVAAAAREKKKKCKLDVAAIELHDGTIITGKLTDELMPPSTMMLNALKHLAGVDDAVMVLSPDIIQRIKTMKENVLRQNNSRLHLDELLIILSVETRNDPLCQLLLDQVDKIRGCEANSTYIGSAKSEQVFKRLGINITCEPTQIIK